MPNQDPAETSSLFSLTGIRERRKEKRNSVSRTAKTNASIAAKLRTKAIRITDNSSIIKITLKQNNKALALALTAAKGEARELTKEKMLLQKEVKLGDFERARLRQKLFTVANLLAQLHRKHNEYIEELQLMNSQLLDIVKLSSPSESNSCSLLPSDERPSDERHSTTDMTDNLADDNRPIRTAPKAMKIPLLQDDDNRCENGKGDLASTNQPVLPLQLPTSAVGEPLKSVANPALEKPSFSHLIDEPMAGSERNGQPSGQVDGSALALDLDVLFGGKPSSIPQSSRSCSLSILSNNSLGQCSQISQLPNDWVLPSLRHITERRKRTTDFSASFRECPWTELSGKGLLAGWTPPKETEPAESSQVGELVTLKAQNKSYKKIKASEAKALEKKSIGIEGRGSPTIESKGNLDDGSEGAAPNATQPKALGNNTTIVLEVSAQGDHLEKIQPLNSHGQNESHNSQSFYKTKGPSPIHAASPDRVEDFSFSENSSSNNFERASQLSNKAGVCGKISAVDLAPRKDSRHVAQAAKSQKTPAKCCALPKTSAVVNKINNWVPPGGQKTMQETCKESSPKTALHRNENEILKDLTNAAQPLLEEPLIRRTTRARKPVSYEEPKLNRKLRRGDPFANSDFFSCPIYRTRKKKMTKSETISKESSSDPVPASLWK